jgi:hypothetical protein
MVRVRNVALAALLVAAAAGSATAQDVASVNNLAPEQMRLRFQIAAMEGVLERAVQLGARRLSQQVQAMSPEMLFIAGAARARGFRLEGHGVFFDVDVPAMRRSLAWSLRTLGPDPNTEAAVQSLRRSIATVRDPGARREMEEALQRLTRTVTPPGTGAVAATGTGGRTLGPTVVSSTGAAPASAAAPSAAAGPTLVDDPGLAYTNEVKTALIDAMIEYGAPIPIADNEWLTIAARDDNDSRLGGGDPYDVSTIIVRIKGSDLAAFRAQRLTRDEALAKVEVREY